MMTRFALKQATDDLHRELDDRLSRLNLSDRSDYRDFLSFHARTVPPFEDALEAAGAGDILEGWEQARRTPAIRSDLAALGEPVPQAASVPAIAGTAELLGTAYVIEGSRLGSKVLRGRVPSEFPISFLSHPSTGSWTYVIAALDRFIYSDEMIGEAKDAARRCFTLFLSVASEAGL